MDEIHVSLIFEARVWANQEAELNWVSHPIGGRGWTLVEDKERKNVSWIGTGMIHQHRNYDKLTLTHVETPLERRRPF